MATTGGREGAVPPAIGGVIAGADGASAGGFGVGAGTAVAAAGAAVAIGAASGFAAVGLTDTADHTHHIAAAALARAITPSIGASARRRGGKAIGARMVVA